MPPPCNLLFEQALGYFENLPLELLRGECCLQSMSVLRILEVDRLAFSFVPPPRLVGGCVCYALRLRKAVASQALYNRITGLFNVTQVTGGDKDRFDTVAAAIGYANRLRFMHDRLFRTFGRSNLAMSSGQ